MSLKESYSTSCVGVPVFMNCIDDSPLHAADESCYSSIKDEPLDITECSLKDFKSELEDFDVDIKDEPFLKGNTNYVSDSNETNVINIIGKNSSGIIKKSLHNITNNKVPVTRKLIIDGQEKTCILVKNPSLNDTIMESVQRDGETVNNATNLNEKLFNETETNSMVTSPATSCLSDHTYSLNKNIERFMVTCPRCFGVVHINNFKQHINSCFPRKTFRDKMNCDEANENKRTNSHQTVCNSFTGEVDALNDNINTSNSCYKNEENSNLNDNTLKNTGLKTDRFKATQNCSFCSFSTSDLVTLILHLRKHQFDLVTRKTAFGRFIYYCKMCSFAVPTLSRINGHMNTHERNLPIGKCPKCDFRSTPHALNYHIQECLTSNTPKCTETSEGETSQNTVEYSESDNVSSEKSIQCAFCSFSTRDKLKLQLHVKEKHFFKFVKDPFRRLVYRCKLCSYSNRAFISMIRHMNWHKNNAPIVKCSNCDFKSTLKVLKYHRKECKLANVEVNKDILEKAAKKKSVDCTEQNEISSKSAKLNFDLQNSSKTTLNTSDVECSKLVSDQNSFQSFEPDKELSRDIRKYLLKPKFSLTSSGTYYFQCRLCSYGDRLERRVTNHINTHKKKWPILNCPYNCGFKSTIYAVKYHKKQCKRGHAFKCSVCTFSTSLRIKLKLHVKKRHFNKLFSCSYCSFFTRYKSKQMEHLKRHKKCPYCSFEGVFNIINAHVPECVHKPKSFVGIEK